MGVVFLTEAGKTYGYGHLMRCRAIADALSEHGKKSYFIIDMPPSLKEEMQGSAHRRCGWQKKREVLKSAFFRLPAGFSVDAAVADSYQALPEVLADLAEMDFPVFYLDDYQRLEYPAGVVIAPSPAASRKWYMRRPGRDVYVGVEYMPLRKPFWDIRALPYQKRKGIVVTLGGSECGGSLAFIVQALKARAKEGITVLAPGERSIAGADAVTENLSAGQMQEAISGARVIVCGGGGTLVEAARCGTPAVVIEVADNQRRNIKFWTDKGFALYAGVNGSPELAASVADKIAALDDEKVWKKAIAAGASAVDGQGARRIAHIIVSESEFFQKSRPLRDNYVIGGYTLKNFLSCTADERAAILAARNTESVVSGSFSQRKISEKEHRAFITALPFSAGGYWLVDRAGRHVGVISVTEADFSASEGMLGYYKMPGYGEKGVGRALVKLAAAVAFEKLNLQALTAFCLDSNAASYLSLERAGFHLVAMEEKLVGGEKALLRKYRLLSS